MAVARKLALYAIVFSACDATMKNGVIFAVHEEKL
jgi:hypothetical protein